MMNLQGIHTEKNTEQGLEFLIRGAAKNNPYCYYYLAMLHSEGILVEKSSKLEFLYLKRAAEEGFV